MHLISGADCIQKIIGKTRKLLIKSHYLMVVKQGREKMTVTVEKEQERVVSRGGNSSVLYLPKEYFSPGEKVSSRLEIDTDGNLKMVLTKKLFNFTCDSIKALVEKDLDVEYDKTVAGTKIFSATKGNLSLNCTKSPQELEPTIVAISRSFNQIRTAKEYKALMAILKGLAAKDFDAYVEPEGDLATIQVYKDPQTYKLKDEYEAIEALNETGRKIGFSIVVRFNSKKNSTEQIKTALTDLAPKG